MVIILKALRSVKIGLNATSRAYPLRNLSEEMLDRKNYFAMENIQVIAGEHLDNCF
jgi:hypothetical protein